MAYLRRRSKVLTAYLEGLVRKTFERKQAKLDLLTPVNPEERGAQLSIRFSQNVRKVHIELEKRGVVVSLFFNFYILLIKEKSIWQRCKFWR